MTTPAALTRLALVFTAIFALPARADVATDMSRDGVARLFYVHNGAVARADCAAGAIAFDRGDCRFNVVTASEDALIVALAGPDLRSLPDVERQMSEYWLNLQRTQARVLELTTLLPRGSWKTCGASPRKAIGASPRFAPTSSALTSRAALARWKSTE